MIRQLIWFLLRWEGRKRRAMSAMSKQAWQCLRGHHNTPGQKRCESCVLPRWLHKYSLGAAVCLVLLGIGSGWTALSQFLKEWDYTALLTQVMADGKIARTGTSSTARVSEPNAIAAPAAARRAVDLKEVREALEEGHLRDAHQAITRFAKAYPQDVDVRRLRTELERDINARIQVRVLGNTAGRSELDTEQAALILTGAETSFRLYVTPQEQLYFYLYAADQGGRLRALYPLENEERRLEGGHSYWFPSELPEHGYPLREEGHTIERLYMVASRWPARELERAHSGLEGGHREDASDSLRDALKTRQEPRLGGSSVITVQFVGRGNSL